MATPDRRADAKRQQVAMEAIHALRQIHAEMHRLLASIPDQGISVADMLVLHKLVHGGSVTPGQIATETGLTSGGVTNLIDRLEQKALVARRRSSEDRRVVFVSLAADAHARMASMLGTAHAEATRLFDGWSVARIRALVDLLADLRLGHAPR